jgi:flagellum-specific ATP synthase
VTDEQQRADATRLRRMLAAHRDVRELVEIGAYATGTDADADAAIARMPQIESFLQQPMSEVSPLEATWSRLSGLVAS